MPPSTKSRADIVPAVSTFAFKDHRLNTLKPYKGALEICAFAPIWDFMMI